MRWPRCAQKPQRLLHLDHRPAAKRVVARPIYRVQELRSIFILGGMSTRGLATLRRSVRARRFYEASLDIFWLVLLGLAIALPILTASPTLADDLVRYTVRVSFLYYALTVNLMLWLGPADWQAVSRPGRLTRRSWMLAWAAYLVHLAFAFALYHHGSHSEAVEHVREASGTGEGIYVSHLFTLLWTVDVAWWQLRPLAYAARSSWFDRLLHAFMLFLWFNGTVVYETGPIRWAGLLFFIELAGMLTYSQFSRRGHREHREKIENQS